MQLTTLIIILILVILALELSKHIALKIVAKSLLVVIMMIIIFMVIIGALSSENELHTKNKIIQTGATIVEEIKETSWIEDITEKTKKYIKDFRK